MGFLQPVLFVLHAKENSEVVLVFRKTGGVVESARGLRNAVLDEEVQVEERVEVKTGEKGCRCRTRERKMLGFTEPGGGWYV
jgi:hypothetical protein